MAKIVGTDFSYAFASFGSHISQYSDEDTFGRMSAEVLQVIIVTDDASREHYPSTLFTSREAYQGSCTAKSTIYCANVAAGVMLVQFTKYLRRLPIDADIQMNLLSMELTVNS